MPTKQWSFAINHNSDANFRAWGSDLSTSLGQVGLVQTADTGQINWTTVARPATNTYAGYEIWRFADSSIFMKWEYGTGSSATSSAIRLQVGTGSNGSGTLTGTTSTASAIGGDNSPNGALRTSYLSRDVNNTFFGFCGYQSPTVADDPPFFGFFVCRTVDANTLPTALGAAVYGQSPSNAPSSPRVQILNLQANITGTVNTTREFCFVPFALTSSLINGTPQFFTHWVALPPPTPQVFPIFPLCTLVSVEIAPGITFYANPIGSSPRTFISLPAGMITPAVNNIGTNYRLAMLWE